MFNTLRKSRRKEHQLIVGTIVSAWLFSYLALLLSSVVILGYIFHVESIYRPDPLGPATNVLTALCALLISISLLCYKYSLAKIVNILLFVALLIPIYKALDAVYSIAFVYDPLNTLQETELHKHNTMGINTALCFVFVILSIFFMNLRKPMVSQVFGFLSILFPSISITGYALQISDFYGEMSLTTTCLTYIISLSTLGYTANKALLRSMLSMHIGGKVSRFQIIVGYLVCFGLGYLVSTSLLNIDAAKPFGLYVNGITWFLVIMISISAVFYEKVDRKRRKVERELRRTSLTDPLTGLLNRRSFFSLAERELAKHRRMQFEMSLIIVDIDFFKKINDTLGHSVGDSVLKSVAHAIKRATRSSDILCRYGGEEFIILLPGTSLQGAGKLAEKLREKIERLDISAITGSKYNTLTISAGYCLVGIGDMDLSIPIEQADKALYKAKHSGRNKVLSFSPSLQPETSIAK